MREISSQAESFDGLDAVQRLNADNLSDNSDSSKQNRHPEQNQKKSDVKSGKGFEVEKGNSGDSTDKKGTKKRTRDPPVFLNHKFNEHRWISDCGITSENEKQRLV